MKDEWNSLHPQRQPGPLVDALGGRVEQWYALNDEVPVSGVWGAGKAKIWAEQLGSVNAGAETIMTWGASNGWLDSQPAVISRKVGNGRITYVAGWFDDTLMRAAAKWMLATSGVAPALGDVPEGVEVCRRSVEGRHTFVLINHTKTPQRVTLPRSMTGVLTGFSGTAITMPARGVEVLRAK